MKVISPVNNIQFLAGAGEMGELTRSKDWSKTPLGEPGTWPQSLRTTLGILLHSKFPMFLFWGKELTCFYNDAYRPSLGKDGKHPSILGMNGEEAWPEIWNIIKPLIDQVLAGGEATWSEDQLIPIFRNSKIEDVYWTFSYSPVSNEENMVAGILVTCSETTDKVLTLEKLEVSKNELQFAIEAAELGTFDYNPATNKFTANERLKEWFGFSLNSEIELPHVINIIAENDRKYVAEAIQRALTFSSGGNYDVEYTIVHPVTKKETIVHAKGRAWFNDKKIAYRFNGILEDVTHRTITRRKTEQDREKLNLVIEASELGTYELNLKTNVVDCSERFHRIFGYDKGEKLSYTEFLNHLYPDDVLVRNHSFMKALETGSLEYETRITLRDKSKRWIEVKGKIFYDRNHKPEILIGTCRDITREKKFIQDKDAFASELEKQVQQRTSELTQANESLKKSEERYHLMVEEVQDYAILYLNRKGIVENWNTGAEKIKGYRADEIIGKSFSVFYTREDRNNNLPQKLLELAVKTGRARQEGWRVRKDGSLFWASVVITAVHNEKNDVIGFSKVTHDLTEKKNADDRLKKNASDLEQKNEDLRKMNKELESFAYISSHDLQEPLRKIQTFATLLSKKEAGNLTEDGKDYFKRMQRAAERMQILIDDLLAYSRTNTSERKFENTHLNKIVDEVKADLKEELQQKHATIETHEMCEVSIIPFQFRQLLHNLISNSLKFSIPGKPPHIKIESKIENGINFRNARLSDKTKYCHISISDNGIGFEQHYSEKIFELFQRLHGKAEYNGTGIGLAIVKKIVENHGGIISAKGQLNKGATFDIYFPAQRTENSLEIPD
jgi:PAS domain S-box-containing protein